MAECLNESDAAGHTDFTADDRVTWVLVQDNIGEPRLIAENEIDLKIENTPHITCPNLAVQDQQHTISINDGDVQNVVHTTDINNNNIEDNSNMVTTTYRPEVEEIETVRSHDVSLEKQRCLSAEMSYKPSDAHIELVMDEDLDSSLTNDGSILEHISRQIAIQQPYLNPDSSQPMTYHIEEIPIEALEGNTSLSADSFTIVPNMINVPQHAWYQTPPHPVDLRVSSQKNNFDPVTVYTPTSLKRQHVQYIPARNSTPITMHSILQPIGTTESGRYVYTPHPKTGQLLYVSESASPPIYMSHPASTSTQSKGTNTIKKSTPKPKQTPEANVSQASKKSPGEKENSSPDSSKSSRGLDLDFPMFMNSSGEESREQHNMKERRRRARIKDACEVMRKLVPGMSDKTDKATVFEFAARYIHFLKSFTGNKHDKDFLLKYSPY